MPTASSRTTFLHALALVLGFSLVFILLGASVGLLGGQALYDILPLIVRVGAVLLIVFALRVAHLQASYALWGLIAVALAGATYWLDGNQPDTGVRLLHAVVIGMTALAGAGWEKLPLFVLALVTAGLSWLTSSFGSVSPLANPPLQIVETLLVAAVIYFGNRTDFFDRELRLDMGGRLGGVSYWRSGLVGIIFAAGWTPCVGPILSGILLLASQAQTVGQGALLLAVYSAGLGIPFLLAGALVSRLTVYLPRIYRHLPTISIISGILLALIGILIFTDSLAQLARFGSVASGIEESITGESGELSLLIAFLGGLISFLSPCVLPLVPAYLGYLSGAALGGRGAGAQTARV